MLNVELMLIQLSNILMTQSMKPYRNNMTFEGEGRLGEMVLMKI